MKEALQRVALRYKAIFLDVNRKEVNKKSEPTAAVLALVRRLFECGYTLSEELLHSLNMLSAKDLVQISEVIENALGLKLNWMPLVKDWEKPTEESAVDHLITAFCNCFALEGKMSGATLPCGHFIPEGTFPLERYNACPFCGTPFQTSEFVYKGRGSKLKELRLYTKSDLEELFMALLTSPLPLDATQMDSLKILADCFDIPKGITPSVKEICMVMIAAQLKKGNEKEVMQYLQTPTDILRFLWFEKTGKAIIIRPHILVRTAQKWYGILGQGPYKGKKDMRNAMKEKLKLKYPRTTCRRVATWLNNLPMDVEAAAENMHPHRGMWVRFIRALRLAEYSKKPGFENLARLMDVFYKQEYKVWNSELNQAIAKCDKEKTIKMLSSRPGLFARCLFATMLRFGSDYTLSAFKEVSSKAPARLLLSLANAAQDYFDKSSLRYASPVTGAKIAIPKNPLLELYSDVELEEMVMGVERLFEKEMFERFALRRSEYKSMYIDPVLFDVPLGVGDRATTLQDLSCAVQGMRFQVEGDKVRLFLHWGEGMKAQYLDMDLSCVILYDGKRDICAFHNLVATGAKHSGDIRSIPDKVGAAEYIDLDIEELRKDDAKYVIFMANAYSSGSIATNTRVGWMNSAFTMDISEETGVAYDPSCVQHMVKVSDDNLSKGLTFGVLDIQKNEITWLELLNYHQAAFQNDIMGVTSYLKKLRQKCSIGKLLHIMAEAQGILITEDNATADLSYTQELLLNAEKINDLLI